MRKANYAVVTFFFIEQRHLLYEPHLLICKLFPYSVIVDSQMLRIGIDINSILDIKLTVPS